MQSSWTCLLFFHNLQGVARIPQKSAGVKYRNDESYTVIVDNGALPYAILGFVTPGVVLQNLKSKMVFRGLETVRPFPRVRASCPRVQDAGEMPALLGVLFTLTVFT